MKRIWFPKRLKYINFANIWSKEINIKWFLMKILII